MYIFSQRCVLRGIYKHRGGRVDKLRGFHFTCYIRELGLKPIHNKLTLPFAGRLLGPCSLFLFIYFPLGEGGPERTTGCAC